MIIKLYLDLQPHEDGAVEKRAVDWRCEALKGLCRDYGWSNALIHWDGLGLDLKPEDHESDGPNDFQLSVGGMAEELVKMEKDFLSGRPYRQIIKDLNQPSGLEW